MRAYLEVPFVLSVAIVMEQRVGFVAALLSIVYVAPWIIGVHLEAVDSYQEGIARRFSGLLSILQSVESSIYRQARNLALLIIGTSFWALAEGPGANPKLQLSEYERTWFDYVVSVDLWMLAAAVVLELLRRQKPITSLLGLVT